METGKKVVGKVQYIPHQILTDSVPGVIYEVRIQTTGVSDTDKVMTLLRTELPKKFLGLKVLWIRVEGNIIQMQISGSPFVWAALIAFLPALLSLIGIAVVLTSIFLVFQAIPGWVIGLFLIGTFFLIFGPKIARAITPAEYTWS